MVAVQMGFPEVFFTLVNYSDLQTSWLVTLIGVKVAKKADPQTPLKEIYDNVRLTALCKISSTFITRISSIYLYECSY